MQRAVPPARPGVVTRVDARALGLLVVGLGGGRRRADDEVDGAVGLAYVRGVGDHVDANRPLAVVHTRSAAHAEMAAAALHDAMTVGSRPAPEPGPPIVRRLETSR